MRYNVYYFPTGQSSPADATLIEGITYDDWKEMLDDPEIVNGNSKKKSFSVCAAQYAPGVTEKTENDAGILHNLALVLDIDCFRGFGHEEGERKPFTADELKAIFEGTHAVIWTTFSSTAKARRWRAYIPLAVPMPPRLYKPLWREVNRLLQNTMDEGATANIGRLGYFHSVVSVEARNDYEWHYLPGELLDWREIDLKPEDHLGFERALTKADFKLSADAISDSEALSSATRYFKRAGVETEVGGRHAVLLAASCRLWWDWALPEDGVRKVLREINSHFQVPKSEEEVDAEVIAGYDRALGLRRVQQPDFYGNQREPELRATLGALREHAQDLRRRKNDRFRLLGAALLHVAAGEAYSEPVDAKNMGMAAAEEVARFFPREKPDALLDLLRPAFVTQLARSQTFPPPTDHELISKIRWVQSAARKQVEERDKLRKDVLKSNVLEAFNGKRDTPYTPSELRAFEKAGLADKHWILQSARSYYFHVDGEYRGPYSKDVANNFATALLSPAHEKIETTYIDSKLIVRTKPVDELVKDFGSIVENIEHSLVAHKTSYDSATRTLTQAVGVARDLEPAYSESVDNWLRLMAGEKYNSLCEWIAALLFNDRPCAALFLCLPPDVGKNLFISGIARLWVISGATLLDGFTPDLLERCPLVFCDEKLPTSWNRQFTTKLRAFLSEYSRTAKGKLFENKFTLVGHARLVFCANGAAQLFATSDETIRSSDLRAVQDRMLMIDERSVTTSTAAKQYLKGLGKLRRNRFVEDDEIAKHALWIRDNIKSPAATENRFLISDIGQEVEVSLSVNNEKQTKVWEWVYAYLSAGKFDTLALLSQDGALFANSNVLADNWGKHDPQRKGIGTRDLMTAIAAMSSGRVKVCIDPNVPKLAQVWYRALKMDHFKQWCMTVDADYGQMLEAIGAMQLRRPFKMLMKNVD